MDKFGIILGSVWDDFQIPIYFKRTYFMNHTNCFKLADFSNFFDLSSFYKGFYFLQIKNPIYFLYNLLQLWTYFQKEMGTLDRKGENDSSRNSQGWRTCLGIAGPDASGSGPDILRLPFVWIRNRILRDETLHCFFLGAVQAQQKH